MNGLGLPEALKVGLRWQTEGGAAIVHLLPSSEIPAPLRHAKLVVKSDGTTAGALPQGFHGASVSAAREALAAARSRVFSIDPSDQGGEIVGMQGGKVDVFVEVLSPPAQLVIVGAGHIAQPLAAIGSLLGWGVTVIDDRSDFANSERFPTADRILAQDFVEGLRATPVTAGTHVVLVTRGHVHDAACLRLVLKTPAAYIGMIGSKIRIRTVLDKLSQEGYSDSDLDRVFAPVGLDIGSRTPAEIAVAVTAEIINHNRGGSAPHLKLRRRGR